MFPLILFALRHPEVRLEAMAESQEALMVQEPDREPEQG